MSYCTHVLWRRILQEFQQFCWSVLCLIICVQVENSFKVQLAKMQISRFTAISKQHLKTSFLPCHFITHHQTMTLQISLLCCTPPLLLSCSCPSLSFFWFISNSCFTSAPWGMSLLMLYWYPDALVSIVGTPCVTARMPLHSHSFNFMHGWTGLQMWPAW